MGDNILKNLPLKFYDFWIIEEKKHYNIAKKCFEELMNLPEDLINYNREQKIVLDSYYEQLSDYYIELKYECI